MNMLDLKETAELVIRAMLWDGMALCWEER